MDGKCNCFLIPHQIFEVINFLISTLQDWSEMISHYGFSLYFLMTKDVEQLFKYTLDFVYFLLLSVQVLSPLLLKKQYQLKNSKLFVGHIYIPWI